MEPSTKHVTNPVVETRGCPVCGSAASKDKAGHCPQCDSDLKIFDLLEGLREPEPSPAPSRSTLPGALPEGSTAARAEMPLFAARHTQQAHRSQRMSDGLMGFVVGLLIMLISAGSLLTYHHVVVEPLMRTLDMQLQAQSRQQEEVLTRTLTQNKTQNEIETEAKLARDSAEANTKAILALTDLLKESSLKSEELSKAVRRLAATLSSKPPVKSRTEPTTP